MPQPFASPLFRSTLADGTPNASGKVYTYVAGTLTPQATYTTSALTTAHTNPVILDASGCATIWPDPALTYRVIEKTAADASITGRDVDNMTFTQEAIGADIVSVKDAPYNAVGNGSTDDTAAIQAAVNSGAKAVYFPPGTYKVTSQINVNGVDDGGGGWIGVHLRGAGKLATTIQAYGTFTSVFRLGDGTRQFIRGSVEDMKISAFGTGTVQHGLYGTRVEEHDFVRVWCTGFASAGASIGYGYVNNWLQSELSYNTGHGLQLNTVYSTGGNNAVNVKDCLLFQNTKFGLLAKSGYGLVVDGCTVEQNGWGGIFLNSISGYRICSYFEKNGDTGYTFTTPVVTVKSDIIIVGSGNDANMGSAFPSQGGAIHGCIANSNSGHTSFIYNAGAVDLSITGCTTNSPSYTALIAEQYATTYKGSNISIENCGAFTTQVLIQSASSAVNNTNAAYYRIEDPAAKKVLLRNFALNDLNQWAVLSAGSANTYRRSATSGRRKHLGADVWEIVTSATGTSDILGFSLAVADYPDLVGKTMWFGVWVYASAADCYAVPYCTEQTFNNNPTALNEWTFLAVSFVWPASGTVSAGVYKTGAATSGSVFFAAPMLSYLGCQHDDVIGTIQPTRTWRGSAVPSAGTWDVGDRVDRLPPVAGQPTGWACTVSGTPGTWVALANL